MNANRTGLTALALFLCLAAVPSRGMNNITASQSWCDDGTFRFTINASGLPETGPEANCFGLAGAAITVPPGDVASLRRNRREAGPVGNLLEHVLRRGYLSTPRRFTDFPTAQVGSYLVIPGRCGDVPLIAVYDPAIEPGWSRISGPAARAFAQCRFDYGRQVMASSPFDVTGVYSPAAGVTLEAFVRALPARPIEAPAAGGAPGATGRTTGR